MSAPTGERPQQPAARRREPGETTPKPSNTANLENPAHRTCCSILPAYLFLVGALENRRFRGPVALVV
jgi:hypothetical protein